MTQYAWVIESGHNEPHGPFYWAGYIPHDRGVMGWGDNWSADHMDAVRFARREDAEKVRDMVTRAPRDGEHRVVEHGWDE